MCLIFHAAKFTDYFVSRNIFRLDFSHSFEKLYTSGAKYEYCLSAFSAVSIK